MSRRSNAPYRDRILSDGVTIEYEGHDEPRTSYEINPKHLNQPKNTRGGGLTQNGRFINAVEGYKAGQSNPELVKVFEKILPGVWSLKGFFSLVDYRIHFDGRRSVFVFTLKLCENQSIDDSSHIDLQHTRLIPPEVKREVWQRDAGKCALCGSDKNLHFDHILPFSRGGTSLTAENIRVLCAKCNLSKSNRIE
jgi:hypothetical protein